MSVGPSSRWWMSWILQKGACFDFELEPNKRNNKGKEIIDAEPNATITTTKIHKNDTEDLDEGEHLFHPQMWVKGSLLQFIVNSGNQKNLILLEVMKWLGLLNTIYLQSYTISVSANNFTFPTTSSLHSRCIVQCYSSWSSWCIIRKTILVEGHVVYEYRPLSLIITLGNKLYRMLEVGPPIAISFIFGKKCGKIITQTMKFVFIMILP